MYNVCGIATSSIDCFVACMAIINNNDYSDEEKYKEVVKKVGGTVGAITGGIKLSKKIDKFKKKTKTVFKNFMKFVKITKKTTPLSLILGTAFDCLVSYFTGTTIDCLLEEIIDKIFDSFN